MSIEHNNIKSSRSVVEEDEDDEDSTPPPPDGGWGWMVVFGSFMIHIITDGVTYSFGVFYDEFLTYFGEGKAATAWILSILVGVTLCSGPISSSFVNRWGCRVVTIAGAILASFSMIMSTYATNVTTLYFTIGIGTGFGFGLIYLPAIVSVTMYFEKKRSLATGIAVCGSGFGTFIFAPIITKLLAEYGWRGALLIIAGIVLECILFGAMFRPLEPQDEKMCRKVDALTDIKHEFDEKQQQEQQSNERTKLNLHSSDHNLPSLKTVDAETPTATEIRPYSLSLSLNRNPKNPSSSDNRPHHNNHRYHHRYQTRARSYEACRITLSHPLLPQATAPTADRLHFGSQSLRRHHGPLDKPDIFYQGSLMNLPSYRSRLSLRNHDDFELRSTSSYSKDVKESTTRICGIMPCDEDAKHTLKQMLDFSLFKDWIFILFTVSNFLTSVGFNVPYVYIVPQAKTMGISSEEASMLLSVIGIANTVGRIVLGFVSDKPWVNRLVVYNCCLLIAGISTAFSSFCTTFVTLSLYGSVFGFTIGAYVGLTSVILVDLLGLEKLTNAFGLLLLFQGIASLIGPPIAGALYDITLSYDPGFYVAGITIALSGIILFFIPLLRKKQQSIGIKVTTNL